MTGHDQKHPGHGKRQLVALLASSALLTAGCSTMETTATSPQSVGAAVSLSGNVHGGNQPVTGASVQLYGVGQNSNGGAATLLATTTTGAGGAFAFTQASSGTFANTGNTYTCPSGATALLYIKSTGGNTTGAGSSTNSNAVFLAPVGYCNTVTSSTFVYISEVTTAAMVAATAQFINPSTESIGADGIGVAYAAIGNAFQTVKNLVNAQTGLANTSVSITPATAGLNVTGVTVTATPQSAKLNTIANILSSCVNQTTNSSASGSNCGALFQYATPPLPANTGQPNATYSTATDTLQAALYMFLNPTDGGVAGRTQLFNLSAAAGAPYAPTLTAVPTDWTIGISYSSTNNCGNSGGTSNSGFLSSPHDINVDISGNVYIANYQGGSGALVELSNTGVPMACAEFNAKALAGGTIDTSGNVWIGDSQNNVIYRFTPSTNATLTFPTAAPVLAITVDGADGVFFSTVNGTVGASGTVGSVYKIAGGATATSASNPVMVSNVVGPAPLRMFPDSANDIWVTSGSNFVTELNSTTGGTNYLNGYASTPFTVTGPTYGIVLDHNNRVYVTSQDANSTLTVLAPAGSSYAVTFYDSGNLGGLNAPAGIWTDGAASSWVANSVADSSGSYSLSVINSSGVSVSANGTATGGYQKGLTYFNAPRQTLVDSSGNVWVLNDNNPNSITEVVGAAVPIYQPFSIGITKGYFQALI